MRTALFVGPLVDYVRYDFRLTGWRKACKPNEHNAWHQATLPKHEFPKVLVRCQEQALFSVCQLKDCVIRNPRLHFRDVCNSVSISPQSDNDWAVHALIRKQIHATTSAIG